MNMQRQFDDEDYIRKCIESLKIGNFYKIFEWEYEVVSNKNLCHFYGKDEIAKERIIECMCNRLNIYVEDLLKHYFVDRDIVYRDLYLGDPKAARYAFSIKCGGLTKADIRRKTDDGLISFFSERNNPRIIQTYTNWMLCDPIKEGWVYLDKDENNNTLVFKILEDQGANWYKIFIAKSSNSNLVGQVINQQIFPRF